ncbi:MAG: hypothetical protein MZV64_33605 [Ignavibacteriales bacterium]|nr:hypothetical protein [Ignavibacteriales bacterium]
MPDQRGRRAPPRASRDLAIIPEVPIRNGPLPEFEEKTLEAPGRAPHRPDQGRGARGDARLRLLDAPFPQVRRRDPGRLGDACADERLDPGRARAGSATSGPPSRPPTPPGCPSSSTAARSTAGSGTGWASRTCPSP